MKKNDRKKQAQKAGQLLDTLDLQCIEREGQYALVYDETELTTSCGFPIRSEKESLVRRITEEACAVPHIEVESGRIVGPAGLAMLGMLDEYSHFAQGEHSFENTDVREALTGDPAIHLVPGPERVDQYALLDGLIEYLNRQGLKYQDLPFSEAPDDQLVAFVTTALLSLRPEQAGALVILSRWNGCGLLAPLALVVGGISADSYAKCCMGALCLTTRWGDVKSKDQPLQFVQFRDLARTAQEFLGNFVDPARVLREEIAGGENARREFKATLRKNLYTNANDPDKITHAVLKTIAAFLNTHGGVLFIGVTDDGSIAGIEPDGFGNDDKFLLHLLQVVKDSMGTEVGTLVEATIHEVDKKRVCRVECHTSPSMVYMTWGKDADVAYVRTGPSTEKLPPSKIHQYIMSHFQKDHSSRSR